MCYSIPTKLVKINGRNAVVDYYGEKRNILLDLDDAKVGDYIYAQGGISVRKIPEKEALEILELWKDIFFELKKIDQSLSRVDKKELPQNVLGILQKINLGKNLTKDELLSLFQMKDKRELAVLYEIANNVRAKQHGNASCVHGIIEFSNYCTENCFYCGIRKDKNIKRYRMSIEEIVNTAKLASEKYGFKALVLQSGDDSWYDDEKLEKIVREIRKLGVLIFLSIGSRSVDTYKKLYDAGARAVLLRFETSNEDVFSKLRPGTKLNDRIELIKAVKQIGYILATGFIAGLPGTTEEDIVNDVLLTKHLGPDMYSFGPLIPTKSTPLEDQTKVDKNLVLKTVVAARFADANSNILVTTALETLDRSAKREALLAGANSMMINATPSKYRKLYAIYDNRADRDIEMEQNIKETTDLLYELGRAPTDIGLIP